MTREPTRHHLGDMYYNALVNAKVNILDLAKTLKVSDLEALSGVSIAADTLCKTPREGAQLMLFAMSPNWENIRKDPKWRKAYEVLVDHVRWWAEIYKGRK